jgi:hypothetical protein
MSLLGCKVLRRLLEPLLSTFAVLRFGREVPRLAVARLRSCHRSYGVNFHTVPMLSLPPLKVVP